ncbi:uncharacterized protein DDB_G0271670 [Anopheles cruzii]|uniref:uncharacterized protein DDB_G0271670 n=1 Tax=Anopheles cruzii TaxID=68878 RepID=UPI0022EC4741|nr:uncharacterized protein DDB_G0271670 [Anopheles cruzii]
MGNGMNKVMPGLYIGNYRDSKDYQQLDRYNITHIVSIHDSPRRFHPDKHYLCVIAADKPDQNLSQYFSVCNDFIHSARLKEGNVLIHCLAGMSRSVTVAVAYIMASTTLSWKEALKVVRAGRSIANPNLGFQNQLQDFETNKLLEERKRLKERFPSLALEASDREQCYRSLDYYEELLESKGVCEGHCKFGKDCPTGICRTDSRGSSRPRKASVSSKKQYNSSLSTSPSTSSQLSVRSVGSPGGAQSCPTSPRCSAKASSGQRQAGGGSSGAGRHSDNPRAAGEHAAEIDIGELSELRRSSSIVSTYRPRSGPSGLYSYTGSAPPSIHGSRVDLSGGVTGGTGSAIYLGSSGGTGGATGGGGGTGSSTSPGPCRRLSMRSTPKSTPRSTPEASPKASPKKSATCEKLASLDATAGSPKKSTPASGGRKASTGGAGTLANTSPVKKETSASPKLTSKTTVPKCTNSVTSTATTTATTTTSTTTTTTSSSTSNRTTARAPSIVIDDSTDVTMIVSKEELHISSKTSNSTTNPARQTGTSNNAISRTVQKGL